MSVSLKTTGAHSRVLVVSESLTIISVSSPLSAVSFIISGAFDFLRLLDELSIFLCLLSSPCTERFENLFCNLFSFLFVFLDLDFALGSGSDSPLASLQVTKVKCKQILAHYMSHVSMLIVVIFHRLYYSFPCLKTTALSAEA